VCLSIVAGVKCGFFAHLEDGNMQEESTKLRLRPITLADYPPLAELMNQVYVDIGGAWSENTIKKLIELFPDGQLCIVDNDRLVAAALTVKVSYDRFSNPHRYEDLISDEDKVLVHNEKGDSLYGLDVFVHPAYRGYRLGRRLYEARKDLCREANLKAILAGGRLPGFSKHAGEMNVAEYIQQVEKQQLYDPILSFQLANDFDVKRVMKKYLPEDEQSHGYATLLEWDNILYEPEHALDEEYVSKTMVRLGVIQRSMRAANSVDDLMDQVEFFVDTLSGYGADFALLPEFFNAPLMGLKLELSSIEAI